MSNKHGRRLFVAGVGAVMLVAACTTTHMMPRPTDPSRRDGFGGTRPSSDSGAQ